jgi:membrane-associated phospholipid phosphatase
MINLVVALIVFMLFPLSSPFAISAHLVNTIQQYGPSYYGSDSMAVYYNTNAAMPSLHFSWTVILGVLFAKTFKGWFKLLSIAYPVMTFFAITLTGNHYILDAIAGGVLAAAAFAIMELVFRRTGFRPPWRRDTWSGPPAGPRGPAPPGAL